MLFQNTYDAFKLRVLKHFIEANKEKLSLVFVSEWMKNEFIKNTKTDKEIVNNIGTVINNSVGGVFERQNYQPVEKTRDFITIRSNLDGSKYCIDLVCKWAIQNPQYTFDIYGKGIYFEYEMCPPNVTVFKKHLMHSEIPDLLNGYKCALMPSRLDSQGVMSCEMATYGIPLITSDLSVFKEVLEGFENVFFVDNDASDIDFENIFAQSEFKNNIKNDKFFSCNTIEKELKMIVGE